MKRSFHVGSRRRNRSLFALVQVGRLLSRPSCSCVLLMLSLSLSFLLYAVESFQPAALTQAQSLHQHQQPHGQHEQQKQPKYARLLLSLAASTSDNDMNAAAAQDSTVPTEMTNAVNDDNREAATQKTTPRRFPASENTFDLDIALFCGGLAFDAYVEPAMDSSRWERGSKGWKVAFCSSAFTRSLYKGLLQVVLKKITDLPSGSDTDNAAEQVLTGSGVDACLLVAVLEGSWKEDVERLEKEQYHEGVMDLTGAAHVGRSSTAWSNVDERLSQSVARRSGIAVPYHVKATWGRGGQAIWPETPPAVKDKNNNNNNNKSLPSKSTAKNGVSKPAVVGGGSSSGSTTTTTSTTTAGTGEIERTNSFYLYVQDPATARLVFTVVDDNKMGDVRAIGSTHKRLTSLIPRAANTPEQWMEQWKQQVLEQHKQALAERQQQQDNKAADDESNDFPTVDLTTLMETWEGTLPLTSKPRMKNKQGQVMTGAAAGALLAGPLGAAAGAALMSLYEGELRGRIECKLNYLPILPVTSSKKKVKPYQVVGCTEGVNWGQLFERYMERKLKQQQEQAESDAEAETIETDVEDEYVGSKLAKIQDLEHCFFVSHENTGSSCAVYRSLEQKVIVVSFRGTCAPVDLLTDTIITQDAWIEGENVNNPNTLKVHSGFRNSLNSISRRLKELILATPGVDESIENYDMLVTGHSLGAALATLFTADIGQFGLDAGRGLPQSEPSDPWWKGIANTFMGQQAITEERSSPPRPKSLRLYNFGSPRAGNEAFCQMFDNLLATGKIDQAYRIVNGDDVVARLPRTMNALVLGSINYEHVGKTVLLSVPEAEGEVEESEDNLVSNNINQPPPQEQRPILWVEGESDDSICLVRDPTGSSRLVVPAAEPNEEKQEQQGGGSVDADDVFSKIANAASMVTERMIDVAAVVGIDRVFTEREMKLISSIVQGRAIAHHLEDQYFLSMARVSGFEQITLGEEIRIEVET